MDNPYRGEVEERYTARELLVKLHKVYDKVDIKAVCRRRMTWREALGVWLTERLIGERWHLLALLWVIQCLEEGRKDPWIK